MILSPSRKMDFLNVKGAREELLSALSELTGTDSSPSPDYWKVRDYYDAAVDPRQNFKFRKVLWHENVTREVVDELLLAALGAGIAFCDIEHSTVRQCVEKCAVLRSILDGELTAEEQAQQIADLIEGVNPVLLANDLNSLPIAGSNETDGDTDGPVQVEGGSAVVCTTIVGSKGLSADHVIVLGCDDVNLKVSRNAFYVALTRARKSLTLMACVGGGGAKSLSPYLLALPADTTEAKLAKTGQLREFASIGKLQAHLESMAYARSMAAMKRAPRRR